LGHDEALHGVDRALAIASEKRFAYWGALGKVASGYDTAARGKNLASRPRCDPDRDGELS
jgi:hypothetical protein